MAVFVLGIIALASIAMSFVFSLLVFQSCRHEYRARSLSHETAERGGLIENFADRALSEVGRLFVPAQQHASTDPDSTRQVVSEPPTSVPPLPQRPQPEQSTTDIVDRVAVS
jgi:hypothetical protein